MSQYTPPSGPNGPNDPPPPSSPPGWGTPPVEPVRLSTIPSEASSQKILAGVLAIVLGALGIHKFVLGFTGTGIIMLLLTITCIGYPIMHIIGIIEGIIYLTRSDEEFYRIYMVGKKNWF